MGDTDATDAAADAVARARRRRRRVVPRRLRAVANDGPHQQQHLCRAAFEAVRESRPPPQHGTGVSVPLSKLKTS